MFLAKRVNLLLEVHNNIFRHANKYAIEPVTTLKQIQNVLELFQCFISVSFHICERL